MARLYLVDDHLIVREAFASLLEAHGHRVVGQAEEPTRALAEIQQLQPELLIVDLFLENHSGFELLSELRRRAIPVRTIVATMSTQARDVAEAVRLGVDGYVLKGSSGAELLAAIAAVAQGRRHFQGRVAELAIAGLTTDSDDKLLAALSARERQVIVRVVNGQTSAEIAEALHLSPKTVESYRSRLMAKVKVHDLPGLVRFALRAGLIPGHEL
ncbi:response regulator [Rubrivivax sp. A210]|uniref:response regulator n=1 Tax=Rubrivivax sp. A210 TaxID=2772301 RepID=UPI00191AA565|nr:response regulator transcription factor [Rubrivivax sp. A210]